MQSPIHALLIGIDHYACATVPDLGGAVNDVHALAALLQQRFHVPPSQISMLTNEAATVAGVKQAIRQQLLAPVRAHVQQHPDAEPPTVLLHFSGHGSQAPDPTGQKPSGLDETLVCHDSRLPNIYDLKDWELGQLLDEVGQQTENITVVLDCCHSGSGTRNAGQRAEKMVSAVRSCVPDRRAQPAPTTPRGSQPATANHVLLAACLNREKAYEYIPGTTAAGEAAPSATHDYAQQRHGALTYHLLQVLHELDPANPPTHYEVYEQVRARVAAHFQQSVQCEGDWGRVVLGSARPNRDLWITITEQRGDRYLIDAGAVHGMQPGVRLAAHPPTARTAAEAGAPLGWLAVVDVDVTESECELVTADPALTVPTEPLPRHARLAPALATLLPARRTLVVDIRYAQVAAAACERLAQDDLASLIALRQPDQDAELRLTLHGEMILLQSAAGGQLGPAHPIRQLNPRRRPFVASDFDPIAAALKRIVRVQAFEALEHLGSPLASTLAIEVARLHVDTTSGQLATRPLADTTAAARELPTLGRGEPFVITLQNHSLDPLYIGVLLIDTGWRVQQLYPDLHGSHVQLAPGKRFAIGKSADPAKQLRLPPALSGPVADTGPTAAPGGSGPARATLLIIATQQATDFNSLLQREEALATAVREQQRNPKRAFKLVPERAPTDAWLIKRIRLQVTG